MNYISKKLNLSFPYDWSNPNMSEDVLIHHVLKKGIFNDILKVCYHLDYDRVEKILESNDYSNITLQIMKNIKLGIELAREESYENK